MINTPTGTTRIDEINRCLDRSWLSVEDEKRFGLFNAATAEEFKKELGGIQSKMPGPGFRGVIGVGQKVFLPDEQFIGLTTKLFIDHSGKISHLAVRTARILGHHKMVPITVVIKVASRHIQLSINHEQFMELPGVQDDATIGEEADRALWKDVVLRDTDYREIDVQVRDGFITLNGHVITSMNQWRAETAVKNIPGILGMRSYLIPDDKLALLVAEAIGRIEQGENSKVFTKVENGLAVLLGEMDTTALRDQAEQSVAEIPWVRGVMNNIHVPGSNEYAEEQRFLQPLIGKELLFKDSLSVTIRKVVINPHNRRVVAVVALGHFPYTQNKEQTLDTQGENNHERLMVLPVELIVFLTSNTGFIRINSDEFTQFTAYAPTRYIAPGRNWLPPYPYCTDEVLFLKV